MRGFDPAQVGWRIGRAWEPRGGQLWCPWDAPPASSDPKGPARPGRGGRSISGEDIPILRAEEIRQLPERQALVVAENSKPIIAKLTRHIDGPTGRALLEHQRAARDRVAAVRHGQIPADARTTAALITAQRGDLVDDRRIP